MKGLKRALANGYNAFKNEIKDSKLAFIYEELNERTIDLGKLLYDSELKINLNELTFVPGGSGVLDYVFLKTIAKYAKCKGYLEVGTYIGESINTMTDCCDVLYSVTAPKNVEYSAHNWCVVNDIPDYSERLTDNPKINHFFCNSREFDFSKVSDNVDLYFIDGDHTYDGVYYDTKNIFECRKKDSIVIWHDFKNWIHNYNCDVVKAVRDVLDNEFNNVFVTNNNMCGIYLPEKLRKVFPIRKKCYEEDAPLFVYETHIVNIQIK